MLVAVAAFGTARWFDVPAADKPCLLRGAFEGDVTEIITGEPWLAKRDYRGATKEGHQLQKILTRPVVDSALKLKRGINESQFLQHGNKAATVIWSGVRGFGVEN